MKNLKTMKTLWCLTALMALAASLIGVFNRGLYSEMANTDIMPGILSQDLFTIVLSVVTLFLILGIKENETKKQIVVISIISYLFYGYGIYVIERLYTKLYLVYVGVFGLSFYSFVFSIINISPKTLEKARVPKLIKNVSIGFLAFVPLLFYPLWTSQVIKFIQTSQKPEFAYSIYILDMCFVMPLFVITAVMAAKNKGLGLLLAPVMFVKTFTDLFPVGMGGFFNPLYQQSINLGESMFYIALAVVFLVLAVFYLKNLKFEE